MEQKIPFVAKFKERSYKIRKHLLKAAYRRVLCWKDISQLVCFK